jgi:formylglycine-generating enzyme required for sulfatase activity
MTPFPLLHPIEPVELAPGVSMSFQVIPPVAVQEEALATGKPLSFLMGSRGISGWEEPRHRVVIPQPFYLGTFPVTQEEFACFREEHRSQFHGKPKHPVEDVSWHDAQAFINWLNGLQTLPANHIARLPCEAEWEYACRAGTETEYWSGDGEAALKEVGWYGEDWETGGTHAVGESEAQHPWGLHDMHGNVWEWCEDVWDERAYRKRRDGWLARAWTEADAGEDAILDDLIPHRVVRGGAWFGKSKWCTCAYRFMGKPSMFSRLHGYRILLEPNAPAIDSAAHQSET